MMVSWPLLSSERPIDRSPESADPVQGGPRESGSRGLNEISLVSHRKLIAFGLLLFVVHVVLMVYRYGSRPPAPVIGDEVTINDPAVALSRGQGLVAPSFKDSVFGFDKLYAHFPPVYAYVESVAFRVMGVSVYSLRLTTTVADILAAAVFLWFLAWLWRRQLADPGTAAMAAMLYLLNASVVALHRIARMEPLVELFAIVALWCAVGAIEERLASGQRRVLLLCSAGCIAGGFSMVTHPEALIALLPMLAIVWIRRGATLAGKLLCLSGFVITPALVWMAAYGTESVKALKQLWMVARFTPGPGVYSYAHAFTLEDHRNIGEGMRASLFVLCLALLVLVLARWGILERLKNPTALPSNVDEVRLCVSRAFALATVIGLVLLIWFVGASISRYEVMYPVWLLGLVLMMRGVAVRRGLRAMGGFVIAVIVAEIIAAGVYLWRPEISPIDSDPHRFDYIVAKIPPGQSVAATPMLWLAFQEQNRPFTLLYWRFDGREKWKRENGGNPLKQFDTVIVDESFIDDYRRDTPYAAEGRTESTYVTGSDVVHLFLRQPASQ